MPGLPYDKLAQMPAAGEDNSMPLPAEGETEEAEAEGLSPHLRQLANEMGMNPKQAAALKEFFHACAAELDEADAEEAEMGAPDAGY